MPSTPPFIPSDGNRLTASTLQSWLWRAVSIVFGRVDAPKYKNFILPLLFYKRLSDVFEDELYELATHHGGGKAADAIIHGEIDDIVKLQRPGSMRIYIPPMYRWEELRYHRPDGSLGRFITTALEDIARDNPTLHGVLDVTNFSEIQGGQPVLPEERLYALIEVLSRFRLGRDVEPNLLGQAYEYLVQRFEEGYGHSNASTPTAVSHLVADLLDVRPGTTVYDPVCGTAGLLALMRLRFERQHPDLPEDTPRLYGQEVNPTAYAVARMNMILHGYDDAVIIIGDTLLNPGFTYDSTSLQQFDYVVAHPAWRQSHHDGDYYHHLYVYDYYRRFQYGVPPQSSADWGWVQHVIASLKPHGRAAIVLDAGAVSRGSGSNTANRERDIRRALAEADLIESIILLPENLFAPATQAPGIVLLLNTAKPAERRGQFLLVNASAYSTKDGRRTILTEEAIPAVTQAYRNWETREQFSRVVTLDEVRASDYNLSPANVVVVNTRMPPIFVSHSHADKTYCDAFVQALREQGATVWYDEHDLGAGHLSAEIDQQVTTRPVLVAILSRAAFASKWVLRECTLALGAWDPTSDRSIIPIPAEQITQGDFLRAMNGKWAPFAGFRRVEAPGGLPLPPEAAAQQVLQWLKPSRPGT